MKNCEQCGSKNIVLTGDKVEKHNEYLCNDCDSVFVDYSSEN